MRLQSREWKQGSADELVVGVVVESTEAGCSRSWHWGMQWWFGCPLVTRLVLGGSSGLMMEVVFHCSDDNTIIINNVRCIEGT